MEKGRRVIERIIERTPFRKLLMLSMTFITCFIIVCFSIAVTDLSESKIRENVRDNMSVVLQTIDTNMDSFLANVNEGFINIESNQNLLNLRNPQNMDKQLSLRAVQYIALYDSITQFVETNSIGVGNVYINFADGNVISQTYDQDPLRINYSYDTWKERFPENRYYWINAESCRDLIPDTAVGAVLFRLYDKSEISERGIIMITIKQAFLENLLDISDISSEAYLHVLTEGEAFDFNESPTADWLEPNYNYILDKAEDTANYKIITEVKDGFFFVYKKMDLTDWVIVYSVEEGKISNAHYIIRDTIALTIIAVLIVYLLVRVYSRIISRSLGQLTEIIEREDILEHEIAVRSYPEITLLSSGLEKFRQRINHLLEQVRQEQIMKQQTEIALLQEQVNPHFLYNTLFSIMQLCEMNRAEQAAKMVKALADFYRMGLSGGDSIVSVESEFRQVKSYLEIQHFRYEDMFEYNIECDSSVGECMIPKMSLQPLVENAIYYGIKKRRGKGYICITGGTNDGRNGYIEVHDDGPGFSPSRLKEIRHQLEVESGENRGSFGLKNVNRRIRYAFGEEYGIEIESSPQDTCVRIYFKMKQYKSERDEGDEAAI